MAKPRSPSNSTLAFEPNIHDSRDGWVEVTGGEDIVRVDFHTRVLP